MPLTPLNKATIVDLCKELGVDADEVTAIHIYPTTVDVTLTTIVRRAPKDVAEIADRNTR